MSNIFLIHGIYGDPGYNWYRWLKSELEKLGQRVFAPHFPSFFEPELKKWTQIFKKYEKYIDKDSIIVAHSLGVGFALGVIEKLEKPIKAAFFVASGFKPSNNPFLEILIDSFVEKEFNWENIRKNCKNFYVLHSDNDPFIPLEHGKELAKKLGTKLVLIRNSGHFDVFSGYSHFGMLLKKIKEVLN